MKPFHVLHAILLLLSTLSPTLLLSQTLQSLQPRSLEIAYNKTTNLIFPYAIQSVDRGNGEVLVKKLEGIDNILLVKAGKKDFQSTNLSVVTRGGQLFSFMLHYQENPQVLNLKIESPIRTNPQVQFSNPQHLESQLLAGAQRVQHQLPYLKKPRFREAGFRLSLSGLYTNGEILYLQLELQNDSAIPRKLRTFRLYKKEKKALKRTARQEKELNPSLILGAVSRLQPFSRHVVVLAMKPFSLDKDQTLQIHLASTQDQAPWLLTLNKKQFAKVRNLSKVF